MNLNRKYSREDVEGIPTLTVKNSMNDIPFGVWRDIGRLAGQSFNHHDIVIFAFINKETAQSNIDEAEQILIGACWEKEEYQVSMREIE